MNGSYNFLLHLLGFGILMAVYVRGAIFERTFRAEPDWTRKTLVMKLMNSAAWLGPVSALILLLSGFGNIYNRYLGSPEPWQIEGWIFGKLVLFVVFMVNGATLGRILSRRRFQLVQASAKPGPTDVEQKKLRRYNAWIVAFYLIQGGLLLWILYMSTFGSSKHPGVF